MSRPPLRIGDAERERAAAALGAHRAQGRLTSAEHEDRVTAVRAARTERELGRVFRDLPGGFETLAGARSSTTGAALAGARSSTTGETLAGARSSTTGETLAGARSSTTGEMLAGARSSTTGAALAGARPSTPAGCGWWAGGVGPVRGGVPTPFVVIALTLLAATALTHLPLILLAGLLWVFVASRHRRRPLSLR